MDERHAHRMRQAALLGNAGTKRTVYLGRAAALEGVPLLFADWKDWRESLPGEGLFLKIDPPLWESCALGELDRLTEDYIDCLRELSDRFRGREAEFLNVPEAVAALLDKRKCKKELIRAGLPVTELLGGVCDARETDSPAAGSWDKSGLLHGERMTCEMLLERMRERRIYQVFIKPVRGSGAAGVSAFRWHPATGRMALYTCALSGPECGLVNTKCLRQFSEPGEILPLLDRLLELDCIVERWYAKAEHGGFSYDLRAVVQDGELDFLLARLSKGPVTNLHLNNHPLAAVELGLPDRVLDSVTELCRKSIGCFSGLRSAGIDILLEKGSLKPRIIEMNAQGDLIYQDIYHENKIYRHQARMMAGH